MYAEAIASAIEYQTYGGTRSEGVQSVLLVRPLGPSAGAHGLDGEDRVAVGQDRELVLLRLDGEDLLARHGDDSSLLALLLEEDGSLDGDGDLGSGGDEGDVGLALDISEDVSTLRSLLDGAALELRLCTKRVISIVLCRFWTGMRRDSPGSASRERGWTERANSRPKGSWRSSRCLYIHVDVSIRSNPCQSLASR